jgi:hypothetical protein
MKLLRWNSLAIILAGFAGTSALAGPNAGGALIIHTDDTIEYSAGMDYKTLSGRNCPDDFLNCPPEDLECSQQFSNPTSGKAIGETAVWWILAAFDSTSCPRLSGITFGVEWDSPGTNIAIVDYGPCGDFQVASDGWPDWIGTGVGMTWFSPRLTHLTEVYWFAGYAVYDAGQFRIAAHPTQGSDFGDDSIPSQLDPIPPEKRGYLGLGGEQGFNPIPGPTPVLDKSWGSLKHVFGNGE